MFKKMFQTNRSQSFITLALVAVIALIINLLANIFNAQVDLTEEKRFSLTEPTKQQLRGLNDVIFVRCLLGSKLPVGFKRLQTETRKMLEDFKNINPNLDFKFEDPSVGGSERERQQQFENFAKEGLVPMRLRLVNDDAKTEQYIFPYCEFNYRNNKVVVKLLESDVPNQNPELALNNSIALLEYKFSNAIQKLQSDRKPNILLTEGHDELKPVETADLEQSLGAFYNVGRINLDSVAAIPFGDKVSQVDILIIAKPKTAFTEKHKFQIDQYIMQGGKVMWLIDRLNADLSNMMQTGEMLPVDYPLNLEDQLFKYGCRIQPNMVLDMEATKIKLAVGAAGDNRQFDDFKWWYFPIVAPSSKHPIVKALDRVWLQFPSTVEAIKTKTEVQKTVLLSSSKYSRTQFTPTRLNFEILRYPEEKDKFNKGNQPLAVMLEGQFPSLYENRVTAEQLAVLQRLNLQYTSLSKNTKMLVVGDGDIARNDFDTRRQTVVPLGYDRVVNYKFANKDFLLNAVEYMLDDKGIIEARGKEVKLRLMDGERAKADATFFRSVNILLPLGLVGLFGAFFLWRRRKKYAA
jgi:ABC-2 type transport system permease protein